MTAQDLSDKIAPLWMKNHGTPRDEILGLHEAADKLIKALESGDTEQMQKRVASAFIGVLSIAKTLRITDLEGIVKKRITDIEKQLLS